MTEIKKQKIVCPRCNRQIEIMVWEHIELPYDVEQKKSIMENNLFNAHCEACKFTFPVAYKCIYNDMEQKYMLWLVPRLGENEKKEIDIYNQRLRTDSALRLAQGGYQYRVVRNVSELREKIFIFDKGLDDRYIETMKMAYIPAIKQKIPDDSKIIGVYFNQRPDCREYQLIVVFDNQPPMSTNVNMDIYDDMRRKLKAIVEERTTEGLAQVNADWAVEVMLVHQEKEQYKQFKE